MARNIDREREKGKKNEKEREREQLKQFHASTPLHELSTLSQRFYWNWGVAGRN